MLDDYKDLYIGQFYTLNDNNLITIYIKQSGYTGTTSTLPLDEPPLLITSSPTELTNAINGVGCQIFIKNPTANQLLYQELFATAENQFLIYITRDSYVIYSGFICPEMYRHNIILNAPITIPSNSFTDAMDNYIPSMLSGTTDYIKLIDIIKDIIWNGTQLKWDIYINNTLFNKYILTGWTGLQNPFDYSYCYQGLYLENDQIKSGKTILESILKSFYCRLYLKDDKWFIDRIKDQEATFYKVYHYDGTTGTTTITKEIYTIDGNYTLNDSPILTYNTGKGSYNLTLNEKEYSSLNDNDFTDYISQTQYSGGVFHFYNSPKFQWTLTSDNLYNITTNYTDPNINRGIYYWPSSGSSWFQTNDYLSTRIDVVYTEADCNLTLTYNQSVYFETQKIRSKIGLRYKTIDGSALYGYKFIITGGTDWTWVQSGVGCIYSDEVTYDSYSKNGFKFSPSFTINLKNIFLSIKSTEYGGSVSAGTIISFYLDIYPNQYWYNNTSWVGSYKPCRIGDIVTTIPTTIQNNYITGTIDNRYKNIIDYNLDLFDYSGLSFMNSLILSTDDQNYFNSISGVWCDKYGVISGLTLQKFLIVDLVNQYSSPRYVLEIDLKMKDKTKIVSYQNLFTYYILKDSGNNLLKFLVCGYEYNVKDNGYRLTLNEYKKDDGFYI